MITEAELRSALMIIVSFLKGVSNLWNGIWTGMWNEMVEWNDFTNSNIM